MAERITIDELKSYLWQSAVLLRTHIDAGAYKQYIFPLMFFKRICDVYDEETAIAVEEYGEDMEFYPEEELHTFLVPKGYHWNDVRQVTEDVGAEIVKAFREIEKANGDKMTGIFGDGAWTNKNRLPDRLLKDLLEHFSSKCLSLTNCPEDELGQGYEYLIKQFADDSGHTAQEFYTNRTVVHLMTEMLQPQSGESVYDPTCGSAGMLISCIAHLKAQGKEWRNLRIYGQEINQLTSAIGRMNLFLHGIEDFHIVNDDTLKNPAFIENGQLQQFDLVLANPPYSIKQWDRGAFEHDKYGRNFLGTPPQGRADYAFFQHILKSLKPDTGRCAILFPHGVLFRDEEAEMRRKLVESDLVECVIGIGKNLFFNSPMEACIVICRTNKPLAHRGKILFINAKNEVTKKNSQSYLEDSHIERIANTYFSFCDVEGFAALATIEEVIANGAKLSIPLYVRNSAQETDAEIGCEDAMAEWLTSSSAATAEYDSIRPTDERGKLIWAALGPKTLELIHENVSVEDVVKDEDILELDSEIIQKFIDGDTSQKKKTKKLEIDLRALILKHPNDPRFIKLGERLEKLREEHEAGLMNSIEFLKALLALAKEAAQMEQEVVPEEEQDKGKAMLTRLFERVRNDNTPVIVERIVADIDGIVRVVRFPGWQNTSTGRKEVSKNLRDVILKKYRIKDAAVFNEAYGYVEQYY